MVCILIWKILNLLGKEKISILGVILYGMSVGGISSMMFLRMYMMLTFFTVLFLYINCDPNNKFSKGPALNGINTFNSSLDQISKMIDFFEFLQKFGH